MQAYIQKISRYREEYAHASDPLHWVFSFPHVQCSLSRYPRVWGYVSTDTERLCLALLALIERDEHVVDDADEEQVHKLLQLLVSTHCFYASLGGLLGYYEKVLTLLHGVEHRAEIAYSLPPVYDMRHLYAQEWDIIRCGIEQLPHVAEIYVVGGAGDRLGLCNEHGDPVPVASLPFLGHSLLDHLFRDLEAREQLYRQVYGRSVTVPVVLMTSTEKDNDSVIASIVSRAWYAHRPVYRVKQPLVPLVLHDGAFVSKEHCVLMGKPGGHGVIWKLAHDAGVLDLLQGSGVQAVIVRQINNPLAGEDYTLASLLGYGISRQASFGFAACERIEGRAEGVNVLAVTDCDAGITNIEYTNFARLPKESLAHVPANANVLFASLHAIRQALQSNPLPGLIVNAKNEVSYYKDGRMTTTLAARLESTMQNIADEMRTPLGTPLSTFAILYDRSKLLSVTKRAYKEGSAVHETPEACLYDLLRARIQLLKQCSFDMPQEQSLEEYLQYGPRIVFLFHPMLGPLWSIIAQKIHHGILGPNAELELHISQLYLRHLTLYGSLRILCSQGQNGRVYMSHVVVRNKGMDDNTLTDHMHRAIRRQECCTLSLDEDAELVVKDVVFEGNIHIHVPAGMRYIVSQGEDGIVIEHERCLCSSWHYQVSWPSGSPPCYAFITAATQEVGQQEKSPRTTYLQS